MDDTTKSEDVGSKAWASKIRSRAKSLAKKSDEIFMDLGKVLYLIWDTPMEGVSAKGPLYEAWGYLSFGDYVEEELKIDRRRAQRLRKIWYVLEVKCAGISPGLKQNLIEQGSTKLRELCRVIDSENAEFWYETTKDLNVKQTVEVISDQEGVKKGSFDEDPAADDDPLDDRDEGSLYNENFKLFPAQQRTMKYAIDAARIERTKRVIASTWRAMQSGHVYPAPSPLHCSSCAYREPCRQWCG